MMRGGDNVPGKRLFGLWYLVFFSVISFGSTALCGGESPSVGISPYREYSSFLPFEMSDTMSGNAVLSFPLFVLPQMGGWNLNVSLVYNSMKTCGGPIFDCNYAIPGYIPSEQKNAFGGCWDINLGRLEKRRFATLSKIYFVAQMPDGSRHVLYPKDTYWRSKDNWTVTRLSDGAPTLYAPDGMRYVFGAVDTGDVRDYIITPVLKIIDPYGNTVLIDYTGSSCGTEYISDSISRITDTCGRAIEFVYSSSRKPIQREYICNYQLDRIIARNKDVPVCTYEFAYTTYQPSTNGVSAFVYKWLTSFTCVEENLAWKFVYTGRCNTARTKCWPTYELSEVTTPGLAKIGYAYKDSPITADCPSSCSNRSLASKVVSGCQNDSPSSTWVFGWDKCAKITCPAGKSEEHQFTLLDGCILWKNIYDNGTLLQRDEYNWITKVLYPINPQFPSDKVYKPILTSKAIKRGSNSKCYTTAYSNLDSYDRPGTIVETGDETRTTTRTYWSNASKFMIDEKFVEKEVITLNGETFTNTYKYNSYGKLASKTLSGVTTTYSYDAQGNLAEAQDANGHETRYLNYSGDSFGYPRDITYGTVNNGATLLPGYYAEHKEYTWHGNVASFKDGEGHTTSYLYDSLGRVKEIHPPVGAWTRITYVPHGAFTFTEKVSDGAVVDASYQLYNSLGQLSGTYDPETNACTDIQYDGLGRKIFESYPYIGIRTITDRVPSN